MKKRIVSIEVLRIIAMLMVILLHYLAKGELLPSVNEKFTTNGYIAWFLEAFAIVAVNVYLLISGYFLAATGPKFSRLFELIAQVLFYSILVPIVLILIGVNSLADLTSYKVFLYVFPIQMLQYWFVSAFVIMYLFAPVLVAGAKALPRTQLRNIIFLLVGFFSLPKSLLPIKFDLDNKGYDGLWCMCILLIAIYIREYGIPYFSSWKKSLLTYLAATLGIYLLMLGIQRVFFITGKFEGIIYGSYDYNHILNLLAAVALFYTFYYIKLDGDRKLSKLVCRIAPYTFGVFLLHEQYDLRWKWVELFRTDASEAISFFLLRALCAVIFVFVIGIIIDMFRGFIFRKIKEGSKIIYGKYQTKNR